MNVLINHRRPLVLAILDGWGLRAERAHNAIALADTPCWDQLLRDCAHSKLDANGEAVGLPAGQMGNSEVGHLTIGAGRVIEQDLVRINHAIESGQFFHNAVLLNAIDRCAVKSSTLHLLGLLSVGGVHSHQNHMFAALELASTRGVEKTCLHLILDGRDCPPKSAADAIVEAQQRCDTFQGVEIASVVGRYYAMDRDKRWDRTAAAYRLYTTGDAAHQAPDALAALEQAYQAGESDYFVKPTILTSSGSPPIMKDGDSIVFLNFRADRIRQIVAALTAGDFNGFEREKIIRFSDAICLTEYDRSFDLPTMFPPPHIDDGFGEYIADAGIKQLRLAETEKYAHVTYFFNGGTEEPWPGEQRIMIPSPKVISYDLQPEMSAYAITNALVEAIAKKQFGVIVCNYANGDLVGHSGDLAASMKAVGVVDQCLARIVDALKTHGGEMLITSDHGNVEDMFNEQSGQAHTSHTTNLVPLIYVGERDIALDDGTLADVAPTLLQLLDLPQPELMTGNRLMR